MKGILASIVPRLSSGRTALFLYVLLVVLPAVVFGGLLWRQIGEDQKRQLASIPAYCDDAAGRLETSCADRVRGLLGRQHDLPFEYFRREYYSESSGSIKLLPSPLAIETRPAGILGWFSFRASGFDVTDSPELTVLRGRPQGGSAARDGQDEIETLIRDVVRQEFIDQDPIEILSAADALVRSNESEGWGVVRKRLLRSAILNLGPEDVDACRRILDADAALFRDVLQPFHVAFLEVRIIPMGETELPWVIAYRHVVMEGLQDQTLPTCLAVHTDVMLTQGIVLDPHWLFVDLPEQEAGRVLGSTMSFSPPDKPTSQSPDLAFAPTNVLASLQDYLFDWPEAALLGGGYVIGDAGVLRKDFREQNAWFGGVALILSISMAIGIRLLLSSIRRSNVEAERTRNFVASVTHELRTPIAAVKLYGEMLRDGWITDDERKAEYLSRIVLESDRLDALVDRVLLRRKLSDADHVPHPGDLNADVEEMRDGLEMVGGRTADDIRFDLARDLPQVLLLHEGIHVVLTNLVENARKYAPVTVGADGEPGEPLLVRTRLSRKGRVLLEVLDRGPGIEEGDRKRVFEAFLRLGDEQTRTTKGTGLGLHLVALQTEAMKATVRTLPRAGGGTIFQVLFRRA